MLRAFYGIPINSEVTRRLEQDSAHQLSEFHEDQLRYLTPEFWHITLKFFGAIEPEALHTISKLLKNITDTTPAFDLSIKKIALFPAPGSNTVAAFVKPNETLRKMHEFLDESGEKMGIHREMRRYKPHITLAKLHVEQPKIQEVKYTSVTLPVTELVLYESRPSENGSHYLPLRHFSLLE